MRKITRAEFNKLIETSCGMSSVRIRRQQVPRSDTPSVDGAAILTLRWFHVSDAGNWLFCGRKWIDPADPDGRTKLDLHHDNLCILFPAFAAACSRDRLIEAVTAVIERKSRHSSATAA